MSRATFLFSAVVPVAALVYGLSACASTTRRVRTGGDTSSAHRHSGERHAPTARGGPRPPAHPTTGVDVDDVDDDERHASNSEVSDARSVAKPFFTTYVAFLYGQLPARRVTGTDATLRQQLEQGQTATTPAERSARPRISHLSLSPAGPPISVLAIAQVTTACCTSSTLTATLEPHGRTWLVVAVTG